MVIRHIFLIVMASFVVGPLFITAPATNAKTKTFLSLSAVPARARAEMVSNRPIGKIEPACQILFLPLLPVFV